MKVYIVFQDEPGDWDTSLFIRNVFGNKKLAEEYANKLNIYVEDDSLWFFAREYEVYDQIPEDEFE